MEQSALVANSLVYSDRLGKVVNISAMESKLCFATQGKLLNTENELEFIPLENIIKLYDVVVSFNTTVKLTLWEQ